jgi:hypothetical protein
MATATDSVGSTVEPHRCDSAAEFVRRRLDESDEPRSPSDLASEYGCGNNWMRQVMCNLAGEGEIERVSRGQYVARDDPAEETDADVSVLLGSDSDSELELTGEQDEETDADEGDSMPTAEEYEQQYADQGDGTDADEGEPTGSDNADEGDRTGTQGETTDAPAFAAGVDPRTLMLVVAVAAVAYVAYRSLSGSGSSPDQPGDGDGEPVEQTADVDGGLIG